MVPLQARALVAPVATVATVVAGESMDHLARGGRHTQATPLGRHVVAVDARTPAHRAKDTREQPHGGRLASAVAPEKRAQLAAPDLKRQPLGHDSRTETHRESERFDHRRHCARRGDSMR